MPSSSWYERIARRLIVGRLNAPLTQTEIERVVRSLEHPLSIADVPIILDHYQAEVRIIRQEFDKDGRI